MKICTKCKKSRLLSEFYPNKKGKMGLHAWCKFCSIKKSADWNKKNKEKHNSHSYKNHFKSRYGLTVEQVTELKNNQNNKCAICKCVGSLVVDHKHSTGKIRGMLCSPCNSGLGYFKDDSALLTNAIKYLEITNV